MQIYAGEYQSFAVNNQGDIFAWGLNKNNCLLVKPEESGRVKTVITEPTEVSLPEYFEKSSRQRNVVQNNQDGFDFYSAQKPVQPQASKTQQELEKVREECTKLRKKVKDFQLKLSRVHAGSEDKGGSGGAEATEGGEGAAMGAEFEKLCTNDKVVQSIAALQANNRAEEERRR